MQIAEFTMYSVKMSAIMTKYSWFLTGQLWTQLWVESYQTLYYFIRKLLKCTNSYLYLLVAECCKVRDLQYVQAIV